MKYFFDTEFIESGRECPLYLLSLGIVSEDNRTYYAQVHYSTYPKAGDWVARHVFPHLLHFDMAKQSRSCQKEDAQNGRCRDRECTWRWPMDMQKEIIQFCDPIKFGKPEFWGYYADYDWVLLCQLFGSMIELPKDWPMYCKDIKQLCDDLGNPKLLEQENEHHALVDALWNKQAWEFLRDLK